MAMYAPVVQPSTGLVQGSDVTSQYGSRSWSRTSLRGHFHSECGASVAREFRGRLIGGSIAIFAAGAATAAARRRRAAWNAWKRQRSLESVLSAIACQASKKGQPKRGKGGKGGKGNKRKQQKEEKEEEEDFLLIPEEGMVLGELATKLKKNTAQLISYFFVEKAMPANINTLLDRELVVEVCKNEGAEWLYAEDFEESAAAKRGFLADDYDESKFDVRSRPPVVTVMGHVDHGKTTLLDTIRKRSVAATEAGGITQRIGAYTVKVGEQKVTFIDTPGHEAFTAMRARGAQVTDIAVLVCAADDGVMPQTQEAIAHAKAAEVPMIVCINKVDVPNANVDKARNMLMEEGLVPEDFGGDVAMVPCSAKQNIGIDDLLEVISLTAEVQELKAPYDGAAGGIVLESTFVPSIGVLASLLVQKGSLHLGDWVVAGDKVGRIRTMQNEAGKDMVDVTPSTAVQVQGFDGPPDAGTQFEVYPNAAKARAKADQEAAKNKAPVLGFTGMSTTVDQSDALQLSVILKTDAQGTIAAVKHMFNEVKDSKWVNLRWLLTAPGAITETDVELATSCPADQRVMIIGFNTEPLSGVKKLAEARKVEIRTFNVIYELFDAVVEALEASLGQEEELTEVGQAQILAVFPGRDGKVAGCEVLEGQLVKGGRVKVERDGTKVGEGTISSLRVGKSEVKDVDEGNECGFFTDGFDDWQAGDEVTCYSVEMVTKKILSKAR